MDKGRDDETSRPRHDDDEEEEEELMEWEVSSEPTRDPQPAVR